MKYFLWITFTLFGCASIAETPTKTSAKPSGEQVLSSLFEAFDRNLSEEPLCSMGSISDPKSPYRLKNHLSVIFSTSYESKNSTSIETTCSASKHEKPNGKTIDIWDCKLTVNEATKTGEFISASTIAFGLKKTNLRFMPQSLRCF